MEALKPTDRATSTMNQPLSIRCAVLLLAFVVLPLVAGCRGQYPATYPVRGHVVFEGGKPVRFGTVEFRSEDSGFAARGTIDFDGNFELGTFADADGAVAGPHRAIVTQYVPAFTIEPTVKQYHEWQEESERDPHRVTGVVDTKFAAYESSGLEFTVSTDGTNDFEIVVQAVPGTESSGESPHHHHAAQ
jgi:hypothetical protein